MHRYKSWEHCFKYFDKEFFLPKDKNLDKAALELGFYLASYGMYRGSSFLLWKDYRIHRDLVKKLCEYYNDLYRIAPKDYLDDTSKISLLFSLIKLIRDYYEDFEYVIKGDGEKYEIKVSDALVTKILLGTLCCIPAYDTFFVEGLRAKNLKYSGLKKCNFKKFLEFCTKHHKAFENVQREVSKEDVRYPMMKIIDMYFWQIGIEKNNEEDK